MVQEVIEKVMASHRITRLNLPFLRQVVITVIMARWTLLLITVQHQSHWMEWTRGLYQDQMDYWNKYSHQPLNRWWAHSIPKYHHHLKRSTNVRFVTRGLLDQVLYKHTCILIRERSVSSLLVSSSITRLTVSSILLWSNGMWPSIQCCFESTQT